MQVCRHDPTVLEQGMSTFAYPIFEVPSMESHGIAKPADFKRMRVS